MFTCIYVRGSSYDFTVIKLVSFSMLLLTFFLFIRVWDRRMHRLIALLMEHSDWVSQLVLCRGGEADTAPLSSLSSSSSSLWLASGSFDCTVRLWDIAKLQSDYATCAFPSSPSTATTRQQSPQQQHLQHSPQRVNPHSPSRSTAIKNRSIFASSTAALARRNNMAMLKKSSASTLIPRAAYVLEGHNGSINDIQMQYHVCSSRLLRVCLSSFGVSLRLLPFCFVCCTVSIPASVKLVFCLFHRCCIVVSV